MSEASTPVAGLPRRLEWSRIASFGVLWGMAASAVAILDGPLNDLSPTQALTIMVRVVPANCLEGIVLVGVTMALGRRLTPLRAVALVIAFGIFSQPFYWLFWEVLPIPGASDLPVWASEPHYAHSVWHNLVSGGLFVAAYCFNAASERSRRLFAQAEIARQQTEAWLGAERVRALQGHVDPALLLRVMVELERRYTNDAAGMQRLLDALVAMLRAAMPGVRSGTSTLGAEVLLARQYAALRAELEPGRASWRVGGVEAPPELAFPPLLLMPVLDQLVACHLANAATAAAELRVEAADGRCTLSLVHAGQGSGPWLGPDLLYRLQVGLRALFGETWTLAVGERSAARALVLTLPLPLPGAAPASSRSHNRQEATHE